MCLSVLSVGDGRSTWKSSHIADAQELVDIFLMQVLVADFLPSE